MRRYLTGVASTLMLVSLIAGCSGSDGTGDDTSDEAAASTTAAPAATVASPQTATTAIPTADLTQEEAQKAFLGTWKTVKGYEVYREDGTYGAGKTVDTAESDPIEFGTYTFDGTVVTYQADPASTVCRGLDGQYEVEFSTDLDTQVRTLVEDPCRDRREDVLPFITRHVTP